MIKKTYFAEEKYEAKGPKELMDEEGKPKSATTPLVQFNLPPNTLKNIVDMVTQEDTLLDFSYPVGDS